MEEDWREGERKYFIVYFSISPGMKVSRIFRALVETGCGRIHREPWLARSICILTKQSLNLVAALETVLQRSGRHRRNNLLKIPSSMPTIIFFLSFPYPPKTSFFLRFIGEKLGTLPGISTLEFNHLLIVVAFYLDTV